MYEAHKARVAALDELERVVRSLKITGEGERHVVVLTDYEVANLRELFRAMGYAATVTRNPLMAAHNGDWVGQIDGKLPRVDFPPNRTWEEMARDAKDFRL